MVFVLGRSSSVGRPREVVLQTNTPVPAVRAVLSEAPQWAVEVVFRFNVGLIRAQTVRNDRLGRQT